MLNSFFVEFRLFIDANKRRNVSFLCQFYVSNGFQFCINISILIQFSNNCCNILNFSYHCGTITVGRIGLSKRYFDFILFAEKRNLYPSWTKLRFLW